MRIAVQSAVYGGRSEITLSNENEKKICSMITNTTVQRSLASAFSIVLFSQPAHRHADIISIAR